MRRSRTIAVTAVVLALLGGIAGCQPTRSNGPAPLERLEDPGTDLFSPTEGAATGTPRAPAPLAADPDGQGIRAEIQALHAEQRRLSQSYQSVLGRLAALEARAEPGAAAANHGAPEASAESEEATEQAEIGRLESELASQALDRVWSSEARDQIVAAADKALGKLGAEAGVALISSDCASTMCRLELSSQDPSALGRFAAEFPFQLGWNATARMQNAVHSDGSVTTVVYLSRDGHSLPAF